MLTRDDIVKKLQIENLPPSDQDELLQKLANSVSTRIMLKVAETLSEDDLAELEVLIDGGKDDEVEPYIISKFDDYEAFKTKIETETIEEISNNSKAIDDLVAAKKLESLSVEQYLVVYVNHNTRLCRPCFGLRSHLESLLQF